MYSLGKLPQIQHAKFEKLIRLEPQLPIPKYHEAKQIILDYNRLSDDEMCKRLYRNLKSSFLKFEATTRNIGEVGIDVLDDPHALHTI